LNALIAYATRYGATAGTSEEIAKVLREEGFNVTVLNLKEEKVKDISSFDLVVVGSGLQMGKWVGDAEDFLKRFHQTLAQKKVALFASSMKPAMEREGKTADLEKLRKGVLDDKATKYGLHPLSMVMFGGCVDYNKMNFILRRGMGAIKAQLEMDGFKENPAGVYDMRDWDEIRTWARGLATKAR
jgi:menaquinone-dependent protoporphyrinogen oxidase